MDGWVEWKGGLRPVSEGTLVEVRIRGGTVGCDATTSWPTVWWVSDLWSPGHRRESNP